MPGSNDKDIEQRDTLSVTLDPYDPRSLMFLALYLTPGILDPLNPYVFTHSFGDDPKIKTRDKNILVVEGIDVLNATPLLDIKPYIPRFDRIETASEGWTANKQWRQKPEGRE